MVVAAPGRSPAVGGDGLLGQMLLREGSRVDVQCLTSLTIRQYSLLAMTGIQNACVILINVNSGPRDAASQFETHPSQLFAHEQRMLSSPDDENQTTVLGFRPSERAAEGLHLQTLHSFIPFS